MKQKNPRQAFSLIELVAVIAMLGILATIIIRRVEGHHDTGKTAACHVYQGDIEIQVEIWRHNTGTFPGSTLATIGADVGYFPGGLPTCPVDGSSYTIDTITGLVVGHNH